mmetsp:Transcript_90961/g.164255  ORF Transcript_90961/g.164255 Transcript_90961/m.164255 type:complete len:667 (-) Transcript_90961:112-2112(-)
MGGKGGGKGGKGGKKKSKGKGKGKDPGAPKSKKRRHDDDEITSDEEEDGDGDSAKKQKGEADDGDGENGSQGEEDQEQGEDGEEEEAEDDQEEEEEEVEDTEVKSKKAPAKSKKAPAKQTDGSYVPPHLRVKAAAAASQSPHGRQLMSIMNRVSEGNLDPSGRELCGVLSQYVPEVGSAAAADALMKVLLPAAVGDPNISVLVVGCHAALVTAAHVLFGPAFGAAAMVQAAEMLRVRLNAAEQQDNSTSEDARIAKSCVIFEMLLFSFGMLPGNVVFDLVRFIMSGGRVSEVRVELALTVLRFGGKTLRAECPDDFREVLKFVSTEATGARGSAGVEGSEIQTRLDYLLRELTDLKNNKVSFAVMDRFNQTRGWLQSAPTLAGKKVEDHQLAVPFRLLADEVPGGWPVGGAAGVAGSRRGGKASTTSGDPLRAAAIAQRLTTELRQSLYVALIGAEDVEDAAERLCLVAAGAKAGISEACVVIFHCAVREKVPNPFYVHVAVALCGRPAPMGKRFSHCLKRAAVQHMQLAHTYGMRAAVCLGELCAALIASTTVGLPLVIVRFVRFGEAEQGRSGAEGGGAAKSLGGVLGLLLRHLAESLLHRLPDAVAASAAFATLKKYEDVREGMLLVMDGLVRPRLPPQPEAPQLWEKLRAGRKELAVRSNRD